MCVGCTGDSHAASWNKTISPTWRSWRRSSISWCGYTCTIVDTCVPGTLLRASCACAGTQIVLSATGNCDYLRVHIPILLQVHIHLLSRNNLTPRASIKETNPYLVVATCLYIACKMEECPSHIRTVVQEAKHEWAGKSPFTRPLNQ